jgi:hypothetical protein
VEGGFLSGFKMDSMDNQSIHISHLLFADDTLIFFFFKQAENIFCIFVYCSSGMRLSPG